MDIKDLYEIRTELERFSSRLEACIKKSEENKGYTINFKGVEELIGVGSITGTKEVGSLKRSAQDLKRLLTEKLK